MDYGMDRLCNGCIMEKMDYGMDGLCNGCITEKMDYKWMDYGMGGLWNGLIMEQVDYGQIIGWMFYGMDVLHTFLHIISKPSK